MSVALRSGLALALVALGTFSGCGDTDDRADSGRDTGPAVCLATADCDDDVYCNGPERCAPDDPGAGADGCVSGAVPCGPGAACDEVSDACGPACSDPDADGDGVDSDECGGTDCDDTDPDRYPSNLEICDGDDEDCDPATLGERDEDGDGFVDELCCNGGECGEDCDDSRRGVNPDNAEACNALDDDCDDAVDEEGELIPWYEDADGDGFGSARGETMLSCRAPGAIWARRGNDCDDTRIDVSPIAREVENDRDDDCDGRVDEPPMDVVEGGIRVLGSVRPTAHTRWVVEDRLEVVSSGCAGATGICVTGGIVP